MPKLSFHHRFQLTWELTWPLALMDLLVVVTIHGVLNTQGETLDSVWAVAAFFVASPWVIRRAFWRDRIEAARGTESGPLTYQESLKVMWLLGWRTMVLMIVAVVVLSGLLRLTGRTAHDLAPQGPLANALGLSAVDAVISLAFTPFLIPGMLRKQYRGFRLVLRQAEFQNRKPRSPRTGK
ncbi:MAG: hypothetical protein ACRD5L_12720 [Bryobacteraceae bacterium]